MRVFPHRRRPVGWTVFVGTAALIAGTSTTMASAADASPAARPGSSAPTLGKPRLLAPEVGNDALSADGHAVAWDVNTAQDQSVVRWKDVNTRRTLPVSADASGVELPGDSRDPGISPDGRYVAFLDLTSYSPVIEKVMVKDTLTGSLTNVVTQHIKQPRPYIAPALTSGARDIAYIDGDGRLVLRDLITGDSSQIADHVWNFALSADGRHVVYAVAADGLGTPQTVFEQDVATHLRRTLTVPGETLDPAFAPASSLVLDISGDGRWVTYCGRVTAARTGGQRLGAVHLFDASGHLVYDSLPNSLKTPTTVAGCSVGNGGLLQYVAYNRTAKSHAYQVVLRALSGETTAAPWLQVADLSPDGRSLLGAGWDIKAFLIPVHSG